MPGVSPPAAGTAARWARSQGLGLPGVVEACSTGETGDRWSVAALRPVRKEASEHLAFGGLNSAGAGQ